MQEIPMGRVETLRTSAEIIINFQGYKTGGDIKKNLKEIQQNNFLQKYKIQLQNIAIIMSCYEIKDYEMQTGVNKNMQSL